jgi:AraC-like DNA-binding protein
MQPLPSTNAATNPLPKAAPFPAQSLRDCIAGIFDVDLGAAVGGASFVEALRFSMGRHFALCAFAASSMRLARSLGPGAAKDVDGIAVHFVGADRVEGRMGLRTIAARRADLVFYDLLETVDLTFQRADSEAPDLMLWLPRARLPKPLADYDALHGLTIRGETPAGALIGAALTALSAEAARATEREFDAMAEGALALIAKAIAPALEAARAGPPPLASFLAIRRYIDKHLHAPSLNAGSLARTFGLSRASLYRLFEPVGGVAGYIRAARLRRAYREIVDAEFADRRIGPIVYGLGFKNVSAFNRLFRRQFGASPRELRAGRMQAEPRPDPPPVQEGAQTLREWLRRLAAAPEDERAGL